MRPSSLRPARASGKAADPSNHPTPTLPPYQSALLLEDHRTANGPLRLCQAPPERAVRPGREVVASKINALESPHRVARQELDQPESAGKARRRRRTKSPRDQT